MEVAAVLRGRSVELEGPALVHKLFDERILEQEKKAKKNCVVFEEKKTTYFELNELANVLTRNLIGSIVPLTGGDCVVALDISPSIELLAAQLAVWKCGASLLTLDADIPRQRLNFMFKSCKPICMITDAKPQSQYTKGFSYPGVTCIHLEDLQTINNNDDGKPVSAGSCDLSTCDPCVLLFTSGSTGKPKGVILSHENILNRLQWQWSELPFKESDVCLFSTPVLFVDSLTEIWSSVIALTPLVIAQKNLAKDLNALDLCIERNAVSRLVVVPSLLRSLMHKWSFSGSHPLSIRTLCCSGEALTLDLVTMFRSLMGDKTQLINLYGSTEVTGDVTWSNITGHRSLEAQRLTYQGQLSIGQPVWNSKVFILQEKGSSKQNREGMICLHTKQQGRFLENTNANNKSQFCLLKDPQTGEEVSCYKTGDRGIILDGQVFFLGRVDTQVKIHGKTVNLYEIDNVIKGVSGIKESIVLFVSDLEKVIGFVTGHVSVLEINRELASKLLPYMLPYIVSLEEFPRTATGKVDRQGLKNVAKQELDGYRFLDPNTPVDDWSQESKDLIRALQTVLRTEKTPRLTLNINELGVDSLLIAVLERNLQARGYAVGVGALIEGATLRDISILMSNARAPIPIASSELMEQAGMQIGPFRMIHLHGYSYPCEVRAFVSKTLLQSPHSYLYGTNEENIKTTARNITTRAVRYPGSLSQLLLHSSGALVAVNVIHGGECLQSTEMLDYGAHPGSELLVHVEKAMMLPTMEELAKKGQQVCVRELFMSDDSKLSAEERDQCVDILNVTLTQNARRLNYDTLVEFSLDSVEKTPEVDQGFELTTKVLLKDLNVDVVAQELTLTCTVRLDLYSQTCSV